MDTAIMIDDSFGDFYCNRGLLYYKLTQNKKAIKDYNKAISLDPGRAVYYANIALAYYYENEFDSACEAITKTRQLGMDISGQKELLEIESKHCK
jgi:tetratricopeptide (TPR) repeat protein